MDFGDEDPPIWPPAAAPEVPDALRAEVPISAELDHWTCPELAVTAVRDVVCCGDRVVLLLDGSAGLLRRSRLALWQPPQPGAQEEAPGAALRPLVLQAAPEAPGEDCSRLWPGDAGSFLARCGAGLFRVDLGLSAAALQSASWEAAGRELLTDGPAHNEAIVAAAAKVMHLPPGVAALDCRLGARGLFCAMLVPPAQAAGRSVGPSIVAPGQSMEQRPAATLCVYEPNLLRAVAEVPRLSDGLVLSGGGRQVCVWRTLLKVPAEEAERGEFLGFDCSGDNGRPAQVVCLTRGAGRVGVAAVAEGGELILLQANFSRDRPITTHMGLLLLRWPRGAPEPLPERRWLVRGEHLLNFGFLGGLADDGEAPPPFYVTRLAGVDAETTLWSWTPGGTEGPAAASAGPRLSAPVRSAAAAVLAACGQAPRFIVFGTERADALPELALAAWPGVVGSSAAFLDAELHALPQPRGAHGLTVETVSYPHRGEVVTALLFERSEPPCPLDAPLLVHAHGGPAMGVALSQRMAADHSRNPYRHFLMAGYRILQPLFRGTLGFGDRWSQGNIGSQGSLEGDLGDILAGLDWLQGGHPRLRGSLAAGRTGIFGGSYGGYMTIRAMSSVPERFAAGVALYGFVHNRWMSYEGGDFTWEDEYAAPPPLDATGFSIELVEHEEAPSTTADGSAVASGAPSSPGDRSAEGAESSPGRAAATSSEASQPASDVWPLPREMEASDTFNGLHRICHPLLLMHGEKDDICPVSQSQVAFHMLEKRGVPTGLVVYPGEGHGFDAPEHQRDRDRRMLAWFREHVAGERGTVPDFREL